MILSKEQQSLDSFFNSFDNEKNAYNLKLFFKIILEFCRNLNQEKTLVTRTSDKKIAIEFQGFEIIRMSNFTLQLLILNENNQDKIIKLLDQSDTKKYLSPKGTTLYDTSFELLSLHGNDMASLVKLNLNWSTQNIEKIKYDTPNIKYDLFFDILNHSNDEIKKINIIKITKKYEPLIMQKKVKTKRTIELKTLFNISFFTIFFQIFFLFFGIFLKYL